MLHFRCFDPDYLSQKHLCTKVTADLHLTIIVKTREIWGWYYNDKNHMLWQSIRIASPRRFS